ncbi:MAG: formylglycine-generating enzyme family protein [Desulfobacteraceae bacterium]|jgi:formylglycine-generating enzyme required for sulfatase activity
MADVDKPPIRLKITGLKDRIPAAVLLWLAMIVFFSGCTSTVERNYDDEALARRKIEDLYPNAVRVVSILSNGKQLYGFGFVAGEIWNQYEKKLIIATANHNLDPGNDPDIKLKKVTVMFYPCQGYEPVEAFPTAFIDEDADLTVLEVDIKHCRNVSHFDNPQADIYAWRKRRFSRPRKNEPVWFIGKLKEWDTPERGSIGHIDDQRYKLSVNINSVWSGTSGAPLINRHGKIVGMIIVDNMAGRALAVSAERMEYLFVHEWGGLPFGEVFSNNRRRYLECDPENGPPKTGSIRNNFGMRFIHIESGSFIMGSPKGAGSHGRYDKKPKKVLIEHDFYIQKTEVTQCQWKAVNGQKDNPAFFVNCGWHCPVENVSWRQVQAFIDNLNSKDDMHQLHLPPYAQWEYRLPTEAEWEYACRKGLKSDINGLCRGKNGADSPVSTSRVMSFSSATVHQNRIYDLIGSVREWCMDEFKEAPASSGGHLRVVRGGGWNSSAAFCRCGARDGVHEAKIRSSSLGFRLVIGHKQENIKNDDQP